MGELDLNRLPRGPNPSSVRRNYYRCSVGCMAIGLVRFQLTPALSVATGGRVGGNRRERLESGDHTMMIVQTDRL